jgi:hypothetical protein
MGKEATYSEHMKPPRIPTDRARESAERLCNAVVHVGT